MKIRIWAQLTGLAILITVLSGCGAPKEISQTYSDDPVAEAEETSVNDGQTSAPADYSPESDVSAEGAGMIELPEGASLELMQSVTVENETTGGSFFLYIPSELHGMDGQANGLIYVYPDVPCASEEAALQMLSGLGILEIAEDFPSLVAIPIPRNGNAYTDADVACYDEIRYYCAGGKGRPKEESGGGPEERGQPDGMPDPSGLPAGPVDHGEDPPRESEEENGEDHPNRYISSEHVFAIAEGTGAVFVHNLLSRHTTFLSGILTFGGEIESAASPGVPTPVYLVDAPDAVVEFWKATNGASEVDGNVYYNPSNPQKQVVVEDGDDTFDRETIVSAWVGMLCKSEQMKVNFSGQGDSFEESRMLMAWPSLHELPITADTFDYDAETGEVTPYTLLRTRNDNSVHVFVPDAVLENPEEKVPVIVGLHGAGCGPLELVESCGWLEKAVQENFIVVAPASEDAEVIRSLLGYLASAYPVDTGRIYATGFSLGGVTASTVGKTYPELFAAIAPMGSAGGSLVDSFDAEMWDLPVCMVVGGADDLNVRMDSDGNPMVVGIFSGALPQNYAINEVQLDAADYAANPYWGYTPDDYTCFVHKEVEYQISRYYNDKYDAPVVECVIMVGLIHTYSDYMADIAWDFMSVYSRNTDGSLSCSILN